MRTFRLLTLSVLAFLIAGKLSSQTADEIISKHVRAIGGKERLSKITSLSIESTIESMGAQGIIKSTTLNGVGTRMDIEIAGYKLTSCYTDKEGWSINTMIGNNSAEIMRPAEYNLGKDQIIIGGPFISYSEKGYKVELLGKDTIVSAYKIKFTSPDSILSVYYFDPGTYYLLQAESHSVAMGQIVESTTYYSDYRQTDGFAIPYKMVLSLSGGQYINEMEVTKAELNTPVDVAIFKKPE
jgi:hypothetical protein